MLDGVIVLTSCEINIAAQLITHAFVAPEDENALSASIHNLDNPDVQLVFRSLTDGYLYTVTAVCVHTHREDMPFIASGVHAIFPSGRLSTQLVWHEFVLQSDPTLLIEGDDSSEDMED